MTAADEPDGTARDWLVEIRDSLKAIREALPAFIFLNNAIRRDLVASDVLPRCAPEYADNLERLGQALQKLDQSLRDAFERYGARPAWKLLSRKELDDEEYHILAAQGRFLSPEAFGIQMVDEPEFCRLMRYEDERWRGYIDPLPPDGERKRGVGLRFSRPPEELEWAALRPEQHRFLSEHLPSLYARFRRSPSD